jgi:gluconokinase
VIVIMMGTAGSGKTTVGVALADKIGCAFYDGDDFHSPANVAKMHRGEPLTDEDRWPWLDRLRQLIEEHLSAAKDGVIACSALRESYRQRLLPDDPARRAQVLIVYLKLTEEAAEERVSARAGHYMPASLVASQFAVLEEPRDALVLDASRPVPELVELIRRAFSLRTP